MVDRKEISYKELLMLNDLIPNLCDDGLRKLEQTFQQLLEVLTQKAHQADVTWQNLLYGYLFHEEAQRIIAFLNEYGPDLTPERRREIRLALQMNECQFDCGTVSAYLRERESEEDHKVDNLANNAHTGKDFQGYIRVNSRHRVE